MASSFLPPPHLFLRSFRPPPPPPFKFSLDLLLLLSLSPLLGSLKGFKKRSRCKFNGAAASLPLSYHQPPPPRPPLPPLACSRVGRAMATHRRKLATWFYCFFSGVSLHSVGLIPKQVCCRTAAEWAEKSPNSKSGREGPSLGQSRTQRRGLVYLFNKTNKTLKC